MPRTPRLFVISGPSGAGKGSLIARMCEADANLALAVSATTRPARTGERDGVEYYFITDEEFDAALAAGEFLEWAHVHTHRYGTLHDEVRRLLAAGKSVLLDIDVQGAFNVRRSESKAVLVFIMPPSMEELERRLRGRGTEDEQAIRVRLENALHELELVDEYDEVVLNDDLDEAVEEMLRIVHEYENE